MGGPALAATYTVPALTGASIQATLNTAAAAGSNNTVLLPAGLYNIASAITVPCGNGLTITGPVANPSTAVLNATFSGSDIFNTTGGCSSFTTQYLRFQNTGGIYFAQASSTGITIVHNQFTGLPSSVGGQSNASAALYFAGNLNTTDANITIEFNTFGDTNSCTAVFATVDDEGGYCVGVYNSAGISQNWSVDYNTFVHMEEGVHFHQICNGCATGTNVSVVNNAEVKYNYCVNWHRICVEIQTQAVTAGIQVMHNVFLTPLNPSFITMAISMACCTGGRTAGTSSPPNAADQTNDNVILTTINQRVGTFFGPVIGIEYWGGAGSTANNNLIGGGFANQITWGFGTAPWYIQNNYLCAPNTANGYITDEENSHLPVISGNTTTPTCVQQVSTAATISPAPGGYTSPPTITLSDSGTNTSIYYTTDGSTPVPGSGTTRLYAAPFPVTLPTTVKTVGMWGVPPQPTSFPAPLGYVPSAVASASYTSTGGVVLSSVALTNVGNITSFNVGQTVQMIATCTYSDGSMTNCGTPDARGNGVSSWISSNTAAVTISGSGLATAVSAGSANLTAVVAGITSSPVFTITALTPTLALTSVSLATTAGVTSLVGGGVNQLIATCLYSDSSSDNCTTVDVHGNHAHFTSTAPSVATVNAAGGLVTAVAGGSTNLQASVQYGSTQSQWGQTASDIVGTAGSGFIHSTYFVFGSQAGGYGGTGGTCSFFLPTGTLTNGSLFDCGLILAPTPTTQATSWLCYGTYTVSGTSAPNAFVTVPMSNCGTTIAAGTAAWVAVALNASVRPNVGFDDCGGACNGSAPTAGNGTYPYYYIAVPYGTRSGMPTAMTASTLPANTQASQYVTMGQPPLLSNTVLLSVTTAPPTLASAYLSTPGNVSTLTVGGMLQFAARCVYSDGSTTDCTVADVHGNAVTVWSSSDAAQATIGAVGSATPGLASAIAPGTPSIGATIGSVTATAFPLTVTAPATTLTGLSLATTGGVTGLLVGASNALTATCIYFDGSTTDCSTADSHGNVASAYVSSAPSHATVNATTGVVTGVAAGTTMLSATAGGVSSLAIPLTVLALPSGTYRITVTGPVNFSGLVQF